MRKVQLILIAIFFVTGLNAQVTSNKVLSDIQFYADVMANAGLVESRAVAQEKFSVLFSEWINSPSFNEEDLNNIQWLSVKSPKDATFKLITWQLEKEKGNFEYFGYILKGNNIIQLLNTKVAEDLEYEVFSENEWLGALYYNILEVDNDGAVYYILFGYDGHTVAEHRKIADVLYFEGNSPVFGKDIFKESKEGKRDVIINRLILDYSSDANISLNYNPDLKMIIFDHLIARIGIGNNKGVSMLPDGSYVGYKWNGKYFDYIEKIYDQVSETAPRPQPILGNGNRDLFGKKK
ncbi:MAG: hypothetical protein V3V14_08605 [Saprospiraceae bacterium]